MTHLQLMEEFLTLHYGKAAPAVRRYLDLIYQKVDSSGHHLTGSRKNCSDYGIDEATIKAGFEIFGVVTKCLFWHFEERSDEKSLSA